MITKIKKTIVIEKWLDEDLSKYLEDYLLYEAPHYYGQTSKGEGEGTRFYKTPANTNDPLNRFLIYKLQKTLNLGSGEFEMYSNIQHPGMDGDYHKDSGFNISCIYMVTKTSTGFFQIQCAPNEYCKIPFIKNRLIAFDSQLLHRGRAPIDGVRITLAFKIKFHEKK